MHEESSGEGLVWMEEPYEQLLTQLKYSLQWKKKKKKQVVTKSNTQKLIIMI